MTTPAIMRAALERALPILRRAAAAEPHDRLSGYKSPAAIAVDEAEAALAARAPGFLAPVGSTTYHVEREDVGKVVSYVEYAVNHDAEAPTDEELLEVVRGLVSEELLRGLSPHDWLRVSNARRKLFCSAPGTADRAAACKAALALIAELERK